MPPPEDQLQEGPYLAGEFTKEELQEEKSWQTILQLHPLPRILLARYSRQNPWIPPSLFLRLTGSAVNYRTKNEWQELGELGEGALEIALLYDFPLNILRLWDRFPEAMRQEWLALWERTRMKKNLIREIIQDLHDLEEKKREEALRDALTRLESWTSRTAPFPTEQVRNLVRALRYPRLEEYRRRYDQLRAPFRTRKGIRPEIPDNFESSTMTLKLEFGSLEELRTQLQQLHTPELQEALEGILALVRE